jgi:hypothetical protein
MAKPGAFSRRAAVYPVESGMRQDARRQSPLPMHRPEMMMKTKLLASVPVAILLCGVALPGCPQQQSLPSPTPRPDTPFSSAPPASEQDAEAGRQLRAMQEIHQRMVNARTEQERRALMGEHSRVMRRAMAAMQGMQRAEMGPGASLSGRHLQQQMAMMQMMMQMMMDRIDMLDPPK